MSGRHGKSTASGKRQKVPSLSEMGAVLQQAELEVTGLKADLAKQGTGGECPVVAAAARQPETGRADQATRGREGRAEEREGEKY
jgi:hypothetical protein